MSNLEIVLLALVFILISAVIILWKELGKSLDETTEFKKSYENLRSIYSEETAFGKKESVKLVGEKSLVFKYIDVAIGLIAKMTYQSKSKRGYISNEQTMLLVILFLIKDENYSVLINSVLFDDFCADVLRCFETDDLEDLNANTPEAKLATRIYNEIQIWAPGTKKV